MSLNAIFRFRARNALKNNWQVALLVMFIACLPSILTQVAGTLLSNDVTAQLLALESDPAFLSGSVETVMNKLLDVLTSGQMKAYWLIALLLSLIAPALTAGMQAYMMNLLHGEAGEVTAVFCRLKNGVKAVGLTLLVAMKAFLWAVPGMVVSIGGTMLAVTVSNDVNTALSLAGMFLFAGYILMFWLMIAAMLRYAMAFYVFAQKPECGLLACVRRSKEIMAGRKMQLFALEFSVMIWNVPVMAVYILLTNLFGAVIGLTIQMFLNLFVSAYQNCAVAAFYLERTDVVVRPEEEDEEPRA